jgi:hypothetical protein
MPIRVVTVLFGYLPFSAISPHRMMLEKQYVHTFHEFHTDLTFLDTGMTSMCSAVF